MKIGERMKEIRKSRGWNQDQVAKLLGVTRQAVSHYERGIREPNYEMVEAFADRFNVKKWGKMGQQHTTSYNIKTSKTRIKPHYSTSCNIAIIF